MTRQINCIIVDDDLMARKSLEILCGKFDKTNCIKSFDNPLDAINYLSENSGIDLMFLDIHMPEMTGIDVLRTLESTPNVIITTTDASKALKAFEFEVIDYLIKPVGVDRFIKAVNKVRRLRPVEQMSGSSSELFVKEDRRLIKIDLEDVTYLEAKGDYVLIKTDQNKSHIVTSTMSKLAERLRPDQFVKVHRSFIVNISKIRNLEQNSLVLGEKVIPISRNLKNNLYSKLNLL